MSEQRVSGIGDFLVVDTSSPQPRRDVMCKIKKYTWLALRFCILGPLAAVAVLGCWAEDAFEYLDPKLGPNNSED